MLHNDKFLSIKRQLVSVLSQLDVSKGASLSYRFKYNMNSSQNLIQSSHLTPTELRLFALDQLPLEQRQSHDPPVDLEEIVDLHSPRPL